MSAEKFTSITNRLTTTTIMAHHNNAWKAVTLGYIVPDRRKVDEANKKVLALLFG